MVPQTGNIRLPDGTLIGNRDPDTGVFTPAVGYESVVVVQDVQCKNECNISVYFNGTDNESIDFVYNFADGVWEPKTGDITIDGDSVGYRDPTTGDFSGVLKSVYWDGADTGTDTVIDYLQDSDGNYHPETDGLYIDDNTTLDMVNADELDFGKQDYSNNPGFIQGHLIKPDNTGVLGIGFRATSSTLSGEIRFTVNANGTTAWQVNDNAGVFISLSNGTVDIVSDGLYHLCWLETEENGTDPTKYNFVQYVDGVEVGRNNAITITGGLKFDQFTWSGIAGFRYKGYIKQISSIRKGPGLFQRAPLLGHYKTIGRLRDDVNDSKRFDMQDLDLENPNTTRYLLASSTQGVFPSVTETLPDGYVKKEETYNA